MGMGKLATSHLVTQSSRHTFMSSHGQFVTGQLVTHASRHKVNSSQATWSNHIPGLHSKFFYLHAGQVGPRNSTHLNSTWFPFFIVDLFDCIDLPHLNEFVL